MTLALPATFDLTQSKRMVVALCPRADVLLIVALMLAGLVADPLQACVLLICCSWLNL